jgi:hypothetical protein
MERYGRDFSPQGNVVVRTIDQAANVLSDRLRTGPVQWTRAEVAEAISSFVGTHDAEQGSPKH